MASRSLGELFLRPSSIARTPLCQARQTPASWTSRSISNTPTQPAAQPQLRDDDEYTQQTQEPRQSPRVQTLRSTAAPTGRKATSQTIDSLVRNMTANRPAPATYASSRQTTSSDELRAARNNHIFGAGFSDPASPNRRPKGGSPRLTFDAMSLPTDVLNPNLSNKPSESASLATQQEATFASYPRLNATYGRAVELDTTRGRDLVRGIGMLASLMSRNKIRQDLMSQRFHERGGLKRKRLASQRWRARFKIGFKQVTRRVGELTAKGW